MITTSEPSWIAPFTGLSPSAFGKLVAQLRREGVDASGRTTVEAVAGGPSTAGDRVLENEPDTATAGLEFGVSKSAADRFIDHLGPKLACVRPWSGISSRAAT